jgi:hypothetical protein
LLVIIIERTADIPNTGELIGTGRNGGVLGERKLVTQELTLMVVYCI